MANPRQRRKARSSSYKPVSHSLHAKKRMKKNPPIRGPKVLQEAWDKHKTVRQNYAALGFVHRLNPLPSGGVEHVEKAKEMVEDEKRVGQKYGKIVRDEAGNVVRVEMDTGVDVPAEIRRKWVTGLGEEVEISETPAVTLEDTTVRARVRHGSNGEKEYLRRLVEKYGEDVEGMARDRRLNRDQRTAGELRRGLHRHSYSGRRARASDAVMGIVE